MEHDMVKSKNTSIPHFSSGIVERAKRGNAWKSPPPSRLPREEGETVAVIFTRFRASLALLCLRKMGRTLVKFQLAGGEPEGYLTSVI